MAIEAKVVRSALLGKFDFREVPKTRHISYRLNYRGKTVAITYMSRGHREIQDDILSEMAKQIGVNLGIFKDMIGCEVDLEEYLRTLYRRHRGRFETD